MDKLVDRFAKALKRRLRDGAVSWDEPDLSILDASERMVNCAENRNPVSGGVYAAIMWGKQGGTL
jgi:hypothetical protein